MKPQDIPLVKETLLRKLAGRSAVIGVVGLGYVGLPLALRYAEAGYRVVGFDIDSEKVKALGEGRTYLAHVPVRRRLDATSDYSRAGECDALILCLPFAANKGR